MNFFIVHVRVKRSPLILFSHSIVLNDVGCVVTRMMMMMTDRRREVREFGALISSKVSSRRWPSTRRVAGARLFSPKKARCTVS